MVVRLYCLGKKKSIRAQYRCNFSPQTHFELGLDTSVNACKYIRLSVHPYCYSSSERTAMDDSQRNKSGAGVPLDLGYLSDTDSISSAQRVEMGGVWPYSNKTLFTNLVGT